MTPSAPIDDRGLLLGEGLFETILVKAGRPVLWDAHVRRLAEGCQALDLPAPDPEALRAAALAALAAAPWPRAALRLTWTGGPGGRGLDRPAAPAPRLIAAASPAPAGEGPAALSVADIRRNAQSPLSRLKTLSYLDNVLARRQARAAGADEALMLNTRDEVCGCAAANLFWLEGDELVTPALDCGVLAGVMRAQVLDRAMSVGLHCRQARASLADLAQAQAMFITNSLIGVKRVSALDGRILGQDRRIEALAATLGHVS
jgi:branched-chain amino acid aminotransferase/4-amino-4-deoxychorismate lyase